MVTSVMHVVSYILLSARFEMHTHIVFLNIGINQIIYASFGITMNVFFGLARCDHKMLGLNINNFEEPTKRLLEGNCRSVKCLRKIEETIVNIERI